MQHNSVPPDLLATIEGWSTDELIEMERLIGDIATPPWQRRFLHRALSFHHLSASFSIPSADQVPE